jgi:hopanoid biosynthesis associated protein HpnK
VTLVKKLLVNADDFGLSEAINAGIVRAHSEGIVTSTSIVAAGEAFDKAVEQAASHPKLGVGVHLTLVEERAVSLPSDVPTLAPNGMLPGTYGRLVKGTATGRIRKRDIEHEFRAQIEKCLAAGLKLTHLDSHQHTHTLLSLFPLVLKLGNEYGIRGVRIPRGWPTLSDLTAERFLPKCVLCVLAHGDAACFRRGRCIATQRFAGLFESGDLTEAKLLRILNGLREGTTELVCHPGCNDDSPRYASWNQRRQTEMASLTSASAKKAVRELAIELINYSQL